MNIKNILRSSGTANDRWWTRKKGLLVFLGGFLIIFPIVFHKIVMYKADQIMNVEIKFGDEFDNVEEDILYENNVKNHTTPYDENS